MPRKAPSPARPPRCQPRSPAAGSVAVAARRGPAGAGDGVDGGLHADRLVQPRGHEVGAVAVVGVDVGGCVPPPHHRSGTGS
eukprot:9649753-Alexandrium_andersonii.AAC.1